ncbi:hypothetical protein D3C81_614450 [compost metagenome]
MDDREFIADRVAALKESVMYFGNKNKFERERWVCKEFLMNLDVPFEEADIRTPDTDPPDVEFSSARFEVKEILDPGRKRHDEYKRELIKAQNASDPQELLTLYTPQDITPAELCDLVRTHLAGLGDDYLADSRHSMDLVFYVNLKHHMLQAGKIPDVSDLNAMGWRSICALMHRTSFVLYAAEDAPYFIAERGVSATVRPSHVE